MTNKRDVEYWIENLDLQPHPEGGFFRETYRATESIMQTALPPRFSGDRAFSTAIYYLLAKDNYSAFHRIKQDELWHFYDGAPLIIHVIEPSGTYSSLKVGLNIEGGEYPQVVIQAGCFFAAEVSNKESFSLVGCTVAPGFDFADFDLPDKDALIKQFPQHSTIIHHLTNKS